MVLAFVLWYSVVYFVSSSQAIECQGTARYTLTFKAEWTSQSHQDFPSGAHFSPLVGCSHDWDYVMWIPGIKATTGVKDVAEVGATSALNREMSTQINLKNGHSRYQGNGIAGGTGTSSIANIEVNSEYPLVSFITMIAPSPDWFVGVHNYNLCNTTSGKWLESRTRYLPPYDAGTDSGPRFASRDQITNPPEDIHLLTNKIEGSFKGDKPVRRFGTFTFTKTYDSNPTVATVKPRSTMQGSQPTTIQGSQLSTMQGSQLSTMQGSQPTLTTTSAASSVKQLGYVVFAMILVNFCL